MEEIRSAMEKQVDLVADLVEKLSGELRTGLQPAYDNFLGFFHAIDWKVMRIFLRIASFGLEEFRITSLDKFSVFVEFHLNSVRI